MYCPDIQVHMISILEKPGIINVIFLEILDKSSKYIDSLYESGEYCAYRFRYKNKNKETDAAICKLD